MKSIYYIPLMLLTMWPIFTHAQMEPDGPRAEKIAQLRKAFIAERLALTTQEEQQFWPLYDNYVAERKALNKKIRKQQLFIDNGGLTEQELRKSLDEMATHRKSEAELDAQFIKSAIPIIGVEKASQLAMIEREFKKTLLKKIKERRQNRN
jgi:hypothetical protein